MAELLDRAGAVQLVQEVRSEVDSITGSMAKSFTANVGTTWVGNQAPYTQRVTVAGILASDKPIVDVVPDLDYALAGQQIDCWADVYKIVTIENGLVLYAHRQLGTAFPINIVCIRPVTIE